EGRAEPLVDVGGLVPPPRQREDAHEPHDEVFLERLRDQRPAERGGGLVEIAAGLEQARLFGQQRYRVRAELVEGGGDPLLVPVVGEEVAYVQVQGRLVLGWIRGAPCGGRRRPERSHVGPDVRRQRDRLRV